MVSLHEDSRLPLFWSLHKNSITDKYFECFDKVRLEEDSQYARVAQLKRHVTSTCISNCGSFLVSGYSDGWLIKNFIETGRLVRKFKYTDTVKEFDRSQAISCIFIDSINSFVIIVQNDWMTKLDFFSGRVLAVLKLADFSPSVTFELQSCQIECDQTNNLVVVVSPCDHVLVVNWGNMSVVRFFKLQGHSRVSCLVVAKDAKKLLIATHDKRLGIYDIFSAGLVSLFRLDQVVRCLDIRESIWLLVGAYEGQRSVNLWKIDNLDWKVADAVDLPFKSKLTRLGSDLRACYFRNDSGDAGETEQFESKIRRVTAQRYRPK